MAADPEACRAALRAEVALLVADPVDTAARAELLADMEALAPELAEG
ncbi:MAG TPA: hypothetical protein PKD59_10445 [Miltoncostaeaceae bacterium]|mgnify:CR=1 FL=1|nr:hypothetical protein [Miltoncostaeaceae bacterium]